MRHQPRFMEPERPMVLFEHKRTDQSGAHHHRTDGKIDSAGDDDERDAKRHEADVVARLEDILEHICREEIVAEDREKYV